MIKFNLLLFMMLIFIIPQTTIARLNLDSFFQNIPKPKTIGYAALITSSIFSHTVVKNVDEKIRHSLLNLCNCSNNNINTNPANAAAIKTCEIHKNATIQTLILLSGFYSAYKLLNLKT